MTLIGLEIHCQLTSLNSKLFCSCRADYRGMEPNSNICPVCAGLPGSLPIPNKSAVQKTAVIAMALNCTVPKRAAFFRKNYFYPDLPKNFQITQFDAYGPTSMGHDGYVMVEDRKIRIARVQLEEDPGRLIYEGVSEKTRITLVDYNRAGTPLVEIVTEPDFENPRQVRIFLGILADLLENLGVSDPSLEGAIRVDGNVSIKGGPKVEIKNIGSFHDLEKALHFEITRQETLASRGINIDAETRQWDDGRRVTISARKKEEETDYRYFLEGDIPWVVMDEASLEGLKKGMPESISSRKERYVKILNMPPQVAEVLSSDRFYSDLFERASTKDNARELANIITTDLMGLADTREKRQDSKITARHLADVAGMIMAGDITRASAKTVLYEAVRTGRPAKEIVAGQNLGNVSDAGELEKIIGAVLEREPGAAKQAAENPQAINYLVGKVMQDTKGRADPATTLRLLRKKLGL